MNRKKTFQGLSFRGMLVMMIALTMMLTACSGGNGGTPNKPANTPANTPSSTNQPEEKGSETTDNTPKGKVKPVTFTQYVNYDWFTALSWLERPQGKWITDNLGVTVEPVQSNGAAATKLNSMIVSKSLPDALVLDRGKDVDRLVNAGQLVELDPYLEKYPEFVQTIGEETLNMLRSKDGKLYQVPNWFISGENGNGNAAYLVNRKIHKELGSPALETWSDLEAYLKQVKEKYKDVVPLDFGEIRDGESQMFGLLYSGAADDRTPALISAGSGSVFGVPSGDKLIPVYDDPAFEDTAIFASRIFRQGLTSQDAFTQTRDQIMEKLKNGKIAVFGAYDSVVENIGREANNYLISKDPESGYQVIWPFHKDGVDKNKVYPGGYNTLGWNVNVITKNAKDPEAIFSFFNWAISEEGQRVFFFGPEGMFYDKVENGVPIPNDAYINRNQKEYDELKIGDFNWYGNTSYIDTIKGEREKHLPAESQDWTTISQTTVSFKTSKNMTEFSNLDPLPNTPEGISLQRLREHYKQVVSKLVFAKSDDEVRKVIAESKAEAEKLGYQKVLDWKTGVWQENLKIMGVK